jgi:HD-GYP domain-containing protein (c-di-GMP phosphodiesterase class II)/methyl-accepting chemotaxis protein
MNSLKIKILGAVCGLIIIFLSAATYLNFSHRKELLHRMADENIHLLTETIKSSITDAMRNGRADEVRSIISRLINSSHITSIRILDHEGLILISTFPGEIGTIIPKEEQVVIKQADATILGNQQTFTSISLIRNSQACHGCHNPKTEILGILQVNISIGYLRELLESMRNTDIVTATIVTLIIILILAAFLFIYVDRPINQLISSMQRVEKGDFNTNIIIKSSAEMNLLSTHFNQMVTQLNSVMETAISHERDLAIAQGKLSHHREVHTLNQKLEMQINEIETLNINLEERIEEIEEANYKIADLAGELEDKNSNLEKVVARLSTLYKVGLAINSTMESENIFRLIVDTTMESLNATIGYIIIHDKQKNLLRVDTLVGHDVLSSGDVYIPIKNSSVSSWVINNARPLLISDINEMPQFDRFSALGYERKTLICAPLIVKDELIGTISVVNKNDGSTYTNEDLEMLTTIAAQASIAINNATLYEEQKKTYLNTIHALVSAIEASDSYTRGHSERVTRYCITVAKKIGLSAERLKIIERAAILHDIGKIGINLALLHKVERLTDDDVANLQMHPEIGIKILEPIEFLYDIRACIGQHHERFDGKGYPNGIQGDELLLESRILAIADSFDAMTSDRPYRQARSVEDALQELIDNAGTQFDPAIVPVFVDLFVSGEFPFFAKTAEAEASAAKAA